MPDAATWIGEGDAHAVPEPGPRAGPAKAVSLDAEIEYRLRCAVRHGTPAAEFLDELVAWLNGMSRREFRECYDGGLVDLPTLTSTL